MVGPVTLNGSGDRCFWSWWSFFAADQLKGLTKNECNQKTRSIHVFTFCETQNPDRLDTFDFDKLTLEIITSARKHQTFQLFAKK
jgi:hypothetical protein